MARIPTESVLSSPILPIQVDLEDYQTQLVNDLTEAWEIAKLNIKKSQQKQKQQYDKETHEGKFKVGDHVIVYVSHEDTGKQRKLALPYHGPYRILGQRNCDQACEQTAGTVYPGQL